MPFSRASLVSWATIAAGGMSNSMSACLLLLTWSRTSLRKFACTGEPGAKGG